MAKTIAELRQALTALSSELSAKQFDPSVNEHDRNALKYAENNVDAARQALFNCEKQS